MMPLSLGRYNCYEGTFISGDGDGLGMVNVEMAGQPESCRCGMASGATLHCRVMDLLLHHYF